MKWVGWILGIALFAAMLYSCALPGDLAVGRDGDTGLAGIYTVNGIDPTEAEYSGTVVITATDSPDVFDVEWIITGAIQQGRGIRDGAEFSVEWRVVASAGPERVGRGEYVIHDDGRLTGSWIIDGLEVGGTEEIFPDA